MSPFSVSGCVCVCVSARLFLLIIAMLLYTLVNRGGSSLQCQGSTIQVQSSYCIPKQEVELLCALDEIGLFERAVFPPAVRGGLQLAIAA